MSNAELYYRHFEPGDVDKIIPSSAFDGLSKELFKSSFANRQFVGYTIVCDGEILAVLVMSFMWKGVADVVTLISDRAKEFPFQFHKTVASLLQNTIDYFGVDRVQTIVKSDFDQGKKWLKTLGFSEEGLMKKFGPNGEDYVFMARVKD